MQPRAMRRAWRDDIKRRAQKRDRPRWETETGQHRGQQRERYIMETETSTALPAHLLMPDHHDRTHRGAVAKLHVQLNSSGYATDVHLTGAQLQAIVQQAYDKHGIMASPSYAAEADLATAVDQAMEVADGLCTCGAAGCSDRQVGVL